MVIRDCIRFFMTELLTFSVFHNAVTKSNGTLLPMSTALDSMAHGVRRRPTGLPCAKAPPFLETAPRSMQAHEGHPHQYCVLLGAVRGT